MIGVRARALSDSDLAAFMRAVRSRKHKNAVRDNALFSLLANTGMRPSEALRIRLPDARTFGVAPFIRVYRPSLKRQVHPITDLALHPIVAKALAAHVNAVRGRGGPDNRLFPITRRQCERLFHYYAHKAGVTAGHKVYDLRHTVGARLWKHTKDARLIHGIMGHCHMSTAERYASISVAEAFEVMAKTGTIT